MRVAYFFFLLTISSYIHLNLRGWVSLFFFLHTFLLQPNICKWALKTELAAPLVGICCRRLPVWEHSHVPFSWSGCMVHDA